MLYTIAFAVLSLSLASMSLAGTGTGGFAGFGRTAAGLVNLVMLIVPLMALTTGAATLAGERERGTLNYLLAQPVTRLEVLLGKYVGLSLVLLASVTIGFGASAAAIAAHGGSTNVTTFLRLVALAYLLSLAMLSVGMLISAAARKTSTAIAAALFVWLALAFLGDLGLMGGSLAFKLQVQQLLGLALLNPLQVFKMASLSGLHTSLDVLGPAGLYATRTYGGALNAMFLGVLAAWIIAPLAAAYAMFIWRGGS